MKKENLTQTPSNLLARQALFSHKLGFTLIELLVTVALSAIVAAIAVPAFQVMNASSNCKGASRTLSTDLAFAKMRAVSQGKRMKVVFINPSSYKFQIEDGTWQDMAGEAVRDLTITSSPYFFKDVTYSYDDDNNPSTPPNGNEIVFRTTGSCASCSSGNNSVTVQSTGNTKKVIIYSSGKVEEITL